MDTVVVEHHTEKRYCSCCNQKLPKAEMSKTRSFEFKKDATASWIDWKAVAEYPEDMDGIVDEFVYNTIRFFSTSLDDKIIIANSEIIKVKEFILREVVA